jgi:guanylate kinase
MAANGHNNDGIERRGLMLVLSSPSGAGATTLSRLLIERTPGLQISVSVTTRTKRPGEIDGRDYLFVDKVRFEELVKRNELLEWATVFDNRYGSPRAPVEKALSAGQDVLFDIDWQGTQQLREQARADVVSVFILPPSAADLERRLHSRAQDSQDVIRSRMSRATREMSHWPEYDYIVINREIEAAFAEVQSILTAERLARERRVGVIALVRTLGRTIEEITDATPQQASSIKVGVMPSASTAIETLSNEISGADERAGTVALTARGQVMAKGGLGTSAFQPGAFQGDAFQGAASVQTDTTLSPQSAFELLQARVALLEAALASRPPGMGHNRGPNIDDELSVDEAEIQTFISRLRDQRATAPIDLPKLIEAAQVADPAVNKWRERLDEFAKGALKGAGLVAGKVVTEKLAQAAWFHSVYSALQGVFESLKHWLNFF